MTLKYQFQPIDVKIEGHPKAWASGVEAMGLWLWGMVHARAHRTGGRLERPAVLGAWGGKRNIMLAKRLVDSGLWVAQADGAWLIWNYEEKSAGNSNASKSTPRVKRFRERERNAGETLSETPFHETSASMSMSSSVSLSDLASRVDEVWTHYVAALKRHRPRRRPGKLSAKDRKRVVALLDEFAVEDLKSAVTGLFRSAHHLGMNDRSTEYLELEYALRKPATMMALADEHAPPADTPAAPPSGELVDPALIDAFNLANGLGAA